MFIVVMMMAAALAVGYTACVAISMVATFAVAAAVPKFVEADNLVRNGYKLVHEGIWLVGAGVAGYLAALVVNGIHTMLTEAALAGALIWILWSNSWEARQRGMAHQILITAFTVLGVAGGYVLQRRML